MHRTKPYHPTVLFLLANAETRRVLDAPCGLGWLGQAMRGPEWKDVELDALGLFEFPADGSRYRQILKRNLDEPLDDLAARYDAIVCGETIHLLTNPGVMLASFRRALRPGGRVIITTPNTWQIRSRLRFLLRGFHSGFRPMIGKKQGQDYITYFPWSFPQMHLLLTHYGYEDIQLHEVDEPKPKYFFERWLSWPTMRYCRRQAREADCAATRNYWQQAGSLQSIHGRWMVISACTPAI